MYSNFIKHRVSILLTFFLIVAFALRLFALGEVPGGFHEDEAHIGYNAYSLLKTLHDKNNVFLPLAIDQFGDFRPSGLHFITIPSVAIFGLTEFATRFPVALAGALSVIVFYLLTWEIFRKESIALISAGMMVINPWHFIASRSTSESIVALLFVMFGTYMLLVYLRKIREKIHLTRRVAFLIVSLLSFCLSFQFYHAARYFVPFLTLFILLCVVCDSAFTKKIKMTLIGGTVLLFCFLFSLFAVGSANGRVQAVSIFTNPATAIEFHNQKSEDKGFAPLFVHLFHNKVTAYGYTALSNYGEHFSPSFLFLNGGLPPRYMVPWNGNYYLIDVIFIIIGFSVLLATILEKRNKSWLVLIPFVWLFAGPLPAAFTFEDIPHFQRAIMMMPPLLFLSAYGLYLLFSYSRSKPYRFVLSLVVGSILFYQTALFMHDYFHHTLTHNAKHRNEGQKDLVFALNEYKEQGKNIVMTKEGANRVIFYLFYNKMDPTDYQKLGSPRDAENLTFDRATYSPEDCPSYSAQKEIVLEKFDTIYVDEGDCLPRTEVQLIKEIKRPDGTVAFRILELSPESKP